MGPPATENMPARLDWTDKTVMLTGGIAVALALTALTPVLPRIETDLATDATGRMLVKMLVTIIGATMVIGAPLAGFLADRIGIRKVLLAASIAYAIGGTAGLYMSDLYLLIASRLVVGLAAGAIAATSMTLINTRLDSTGRAKWMGAHVATATLSGLALYPLAGLLGEFGWRWPFALYALGLVFTVLALFLVSETAKPTAAIFESSNESLLSWLPVRFAVLAVIIGSITYLPVVYMPFVLRDAGVSSPLLISLVGLADAILTALMAMNFARSRRYLSSSGRFIFSFLCTGAGLFVVAAWPSVIGVVIGMMVFGLGLGWVVPNLMTTAAAFVTQHQQGRTVGVIKGAHYLAAPLCVLAIEPVTRAFGPTSAFLMAAALSGALVLIFLVSRRTGQILPA